ncbi:TetR/AcrR family transcriptional regulator [Herbiconiux moechotypicola]|uniref:TetR/AcrR family transcriptional regulator n=1 Tax=Herbiconiux moechotypicola TaxID=637393 RepID=A0ABN3DDC4_9MICO|nr:TetR/AcrR family transcriptional regulator [Herbiconiux moechotypicola]MCS5729178.1 TetR/AcrR family transcriptional regulator [Herbiconiux moechotypicola]
MAVEQGGNESIRSTLDRSSDPRVVRTRAGILAAVHELVAAGDELSVSAIVRTAGVSRASFYSHYAGLDDLAASLRRTAFHTIAELYAADPHGSAEAMLSSQQRLVAHFADNRALYAAVAALPVSKEAYLADVRAMAAEIEDALGRQPGLPTGLEVTATARYIAGAAYGLLDAWITGEIDLADAELVDHLTRLLPPWFSGVR